MPLDYPTLRIIWWILLGALLIGFAITDGFDLGIGMLLHRVAKTNDERRIVINSIGPIWEGNQVWLILGAGAIFAAWPELYAISFSGFYFAMLIILFALIIRPVSFKYRSKLDSPRWRSFWDACLFINGFVPALLFGVAVGNVMKGVPFYFDENLLSHYTGTLFDLLNPFAILCGLLSVAMLSMHGGNFLSIKTTGIIQERAIRYSRYAGFLTILLFAIAGMWVSMYLVGYMTNSPIALDAPSNPMHKNVVTQVGAWIINYTRYPWLTLVPGLGFLGAVLSILFISIRRCKLAWVFSALSIASIITTVGVSLFPFLLPSSLHPSMSLLVWDSSSSQLTLFIMLVATLIFLPLIVVYTSWVYYILRGKVTDETLRVNKKSYY